ncbi:MAG TPA: enoyl-CoA hydratase-related protein [Marmoricola sp.]|nr:enoyl-CoA hydratase-related protein [Marmoricola sp.]
MTSDLLISTADGVLSITFNAPETLNALTDTMVEATSHELEEAVTRDDIRVVVITGTGGAFSAGAALVGEDPLEHFDITAMDRANRLIRAVTRLDKPVVAGVNGIAAGVGCSLALACDLQVARESAGFLLAFGRIGLTCDGGTSATVAAAVGRARAMRMALLAEPLSARHAAKAGLISHVAPDGEYDELLGTVVRRLAQGPPLAFAATKKLINAAALPDLNPALERERLAQAALFQTADAREGMRAFAQKRRPTFTGN